MKTVNHKGPPIGAVVSQTCVLHSYTVPFRICHTNSSRIENDCATQNFWSSKCLLYDGGLFKNTSTAFLGLSISFKKCYSSSQCKNFKILYRKKCPKEILCRLNYGILCKIQKYVYAYFVYRLMEKFSKKLVSKCVYLLILKSSEIHLLSK